METSREITKAIDQQEWLEPVADSMQSAVRGTYDAMGPAGRQVEDFLNGTWLGHPLHPVLTDLPVGAWTATVVLDALHILTGKKGFGTGADAAAALGVGGGMAAGVAGLTDWQHLRGHPRRIGTAHALFNGAAALLFTTSLVLRKLKLRALGQLTALLGLGMVGLGGYLGGHLVFKQRIGVNHASAAQVPDEFTPVMEAAALEEGQMQRVEVNDTPVLLVRKDGKIHAMAETCAHLGGPLADGELEDHRVHCPWHNSVYDVRDGQVIHGPSAFSQPAYETRVRNGQIEVREGRHGDKSTH